MFWVRQNFSSRKIKLFRFYPWLPGWDKAQRKTYRSPCERDHTTTKGRDVARKAWAARLGQIFKKRVLGKDDVFFLGGYGSTHSQESISIVFFLMKANHFGILFFQFMEWPKKWPKSADGRSVPVRSVGSVGRLFFPDKVGIRSVSLRLQPVRVCNAARVEKALRTDASGAQRTTSIIHIHYIQAICNNNPIPDSNPGPSVFKRTTLTIQPWGRLLHYLVIR